MSGQIIPQEIAETHAGLAVTQVQIKELHDEINMLRKELSYDETKRAHGKCLNGSLFIIIGALLVIGLTIAGFSGVEVILISTVPEFGREIVEMVKRF